MSNCPECGTEVSSAQDFCVECGTELGKGETEAPKVTTGRGDFVTEKQIEKVKDVLREGEDVNYIVEGATIKIETSDGTETKGGLKGWDRGVFTDERIVIKVPGWTRGYTKSIPYNELTSIELKKGIVNKRVSIEKGDAKYHIKSIDSPDIEECREAVQFARKMSSRGRRESETQSGTEEMEGVEGTEEVEATGETEEVEGTEEMEEARESQDPIERLEKLKILNDKGLITDEEFKNKKEEILDEI